MSRVVFLVLGLVILQTIAAQNLVKQAEELLTEDVFRAKRDEQAVAVQQAETLLTSERVPRSTGGGGFYTTRYVLGSFLQKKYESKKSKRDAPRRTLYSQPGAEPLQIKIMSLD